MNLTSREIRDISSEQYVRLYDAVKDHNAKVEEGNRKLVIDITGAKGQYYTLWNWFLPPYVEGVYRAAPSPTYIKNICKEVEGLINFVENSKFPGPILLYNTDTAKSFPSGFKKRIDGVPTVPIGKYKGELLGDVFEKDPNWVMWFSKNYKSTLYTTWNGRMALPKKTEEDIELLEQARTLIELFFERKAEANRETCKSMYIGALKERRKYAGKVVYCKNSGTVEEPSFKIDAVDEEGNLFYFFTKSELTKDSPISFTGTVANHREVLGRKKTYFNRVRVS